MRIGLFLPLISPFADADYLRTAGALMRAWRVWLLALLVAACGGPIGPIPGGELDGEVVEEHPSDWSFTDEIETIEVETRPDDPYSVTTWCIADGGSIYVGASGGKRSRWVRNLLADPRVRLRIAGKLYERKAVRVMDEEVFNTLRAKLVAKYDYEPDPDAETEPMLFRFDRR
jgi:hypothetical protein